MVRSAKIALEGVWASAATRCVVWFWVACIIVLALGASAEADPVSDAVKLNSALDQALSDNVGVTASVEGCILRVLETFNQCRSGQDQVGLMSKELVMDLQEVVHRPSLRQSILDSGVSILRFDVKDSLRPTLQMAMEIQAQAVLHFNQPDAEVQRGLVSEATELFLTENNIRSRILGTSCSGTTRPYPAGFSDMRIEVSAPEVATHLATQIEQFADRLCSGK